MIKNEKLKQKFKILQNFRNSINKKSWCEIEKKTVFLYKFKTKNKKDKKQEFLNIQKFGKIKKLIHSWKSNKLKYSEDK